MDDLICEFLAETNEGLAELDTALVRLERMPGDEATLSFIFRLVHTIKGTCGFLNLPRLERVAHAAENVLGRIRDRSLAASPAAITVILAGLDRIREIIADIAADGAERPGDDTAIVAALDAAAAGKAVPSELPGTLASEPAGDLGAPTIRLSVDVLENLMTLVSELVLTRNQLLQLARTQQNSPFTASLQRLSQLTSDLQEGVVKTRMQPIGQAWNKLPRLVRDLAHDLGKPIELIMRGQDTELDRQVIELIRDPLTHMIRNSADHGLEDAETRRAAGKPAAGVIALSASHEGGYVLVEVSDDGVGLRLDQIRAKALSRGLASAAALAAMGEREVEQFIFDAGFSTASAVTSVSGRGVGLDVVKTNIERIGGTIGVGSRAGQGTVFTMKIPLTLAIISALIVEANGQRFAIPQLSVLELIKPASHPGQDGPAIETIDGAPLLRLRGRLLPLADLGGLLRIAQVSKAPRDLVIVILSVGTATLGVMVDRVFDTEEIVVKPVAPILRHIAMFSGNTILGDGSVVMILDSNGIARAVGLSGAPISRTASLPEIATERTDASTALLLFRREPGGPPCGIPLGLVSRIENLAPNQIERSSGRLMTQYQGQLIPLLHVAAVNPSMDNVSMLVLSDRDRGRSVGLLVSDIIDVVEQPLSIELAAVQPGLLGSAVIAGRATGILDASYWMTQAARDWFCDIATPAQTTRKRLLVVEDSAFFRQLVVPDLSAAGYFVTAVDSPAKALALQADGSADFDAIVSDIEMPGMDGLSFARHIRSGGLWANLPLIALSGKATLEDVARGRAAGFTDYVAKYEREPLLASLQRCLSSGAVPASLPLAA